MGQHSQTSGSCSFCTSLVDFYTLSTFALGPEEGFGLPLSPTLGKALPFQGLRH